MGKAAVHSFVLTVAVFVGFVLPNSYLAEYDFQIIAAFFIALYIKKKFFVKKTPTSGQSYKGDSKLLESIVFTLIILIIVNTTGGLASHYFFLNYFLLFSLVLLLEPIIGIVLTLSLVVFFYLSIPPGQAVEEYIPILSLVLLTPFALFMGQGYEDSSKSKIQNPKLKEDIFLFLSTIIKNHTKNIKEAAENFKGDKELDEIRKNANRMEKLIDKFEKESL